jgi:hypothetical protein
VTASELEIVDNPAEHRFEARLDGAVVGMTAYVLDGTTITFTHTETDAAFEGRGFGSRLARGALDAARDRALVVVAECPFIRTYMRRHPEYADLRRRR